MIKQDNDERTENKSCKTHRQDTADDPDEHDHRMDLYPPADQHRADIDLRQARYNNITEEKEDEYSPCVSQGKRIRPDQEKCD